MSEFIISTVEDFKSYLKQNLSEHRYMHSLGVAQATEAVLSHYGCKDYEKTWSGFSAGEFCGLAHDIAREMPDKDLVRYCDEYSLPITEAERLSPVLVHGLVSAHMALSLCGNYPSSWYLAICEHTTGDTGMDDLALALFVADFIEPGRKHLTDEKRESYLSQASLVRCAYAILCDMMDHWKEKGYHDASANSVALKADLEMRIRREE